MSETRWTPEQEQAIRATGANILVAAAAGAGKTATLVERIIRRLADPVEPMDVDELLVVTFTEAAASEMRERIGAALQKALTEDPDNSRLHRQLTLLPRAAISTLHSFCLGLLRQYFYLLGLDPALTVMNEHEALLLRQEVMDDLFTRWFDAEEREGVAEKPFFDLVERYGGGKDDEGLKKLVLSVYDYAQSLPWPDHWLDEAAARFEVADAATLEETPWWGPVAYSIRLDLARAAAMLTDASCRCRQTGGPIAYSDSLERERRAVADAASGAFAYDELRAAVVGIVFEKLPRATGDDLDEDLKERVQSLRDQAKKLITELQKKYFQRDAQEWLADLRSVAPHLRTLVLLQQQFSDDFRKAKADQGAVDFNDLERFALKLLIEADSEPGEFKPSQVARDLQARFTEVLVDEYQDINGVQDAILSLVADDAAPNRFMVGDVKQSIYRFRHADPSLFLSKYESYAPWADAAWNTADPGDGEEPAPAPDGRRIVLGANFRSRAGVVDAVNFLFRQILTPQIGEMPYDRDAELVCRAGYPPIPDSVGGVEYPTELHLLERSSTAAPEPGSDPEEEEADPNLAQALQELSDLSTTQREARLVAQRIRQLVNGAEDGQPPLQVWDRNAGSYRNLRYRDIVILLRATTNRADLFLEAMAQVGIPAYAQLATGYFAATEVSVVISLLQVLDNPRQDIPLAAVLRSPIVGFTSADLARIRVAFPHGSFFDSVNASALSDSSTPLARFWRSLTDWRTAARRQPLSQVIWRIYQETGYLRYAAGMPGGTQRHANLLALYDRARQFDQFARQGLFRFLRFIDRLKESDADLGAAPAIGEGEDVVRVMSIHKSKGLEFPVVFVANLGANFSVQDLQGDMLLHRDLGFGPQFVDPDLRVKYPTMAWHAVREKSRLAALAEELRVLYVALTRARERLILVGTPSGRNGMAESLQRWATAGIQDGWALPDTTLAAAKCYLDWIVPAVGRHADGDQLRAEGDATRLDPAVAGDPSRWEVHLWDPTAQQSLVQPESAETPYEVDWEAVRNLEPLDRPADSEIARSLKQRFDWTYPYAPVVHRFGKLSVTELKGHFDPDEGTVASTTPSPYPDQDDGGLRGEDDAAAGGDGVGDGGAGSQGGAPGQGEAISAAGAVVPSQRRPTAGAVGEQEGMPHRTTEARPTAGHLDRRPRFLQETRKTLTPTEFGTLMHLVLQHLDLSRPLDAPDIAAQVWGLVERDLIAPAQAAAVDAPMIARLFATPLGHRIAQHPDRVRREVSFTLGLPAADVYDLPAEVAAGEIVVVQGMIDVLVEEEDGFLLIDYKTDKREPEEAAKAYRGQIGLYRRAVSEILGRPVKEAYLHFLMADQSILM